MLRCCGIAVLVLASGIALLPWAAQRLVFYLCQLCGSEEQPCFKPTGAVDLHLNLVKGEAVSSFITDARIDELEASFPHRPGDVWVTTYPKVGTHWTQAMVVAIQGRPLTYAFEMDCTWPEISASSFPEFQNLSGLQSDGARCFKSHWWHRHHMAKLPGSSKVIYVTRHVEKVLESYWRHMHDLFSLFWLNEGDVTWDQYVDAFLAGELEFGDYFEHIASWWELRLQPNVLWLRYEEMKDDHAGAVRRISQFLGVDLDEERVAEITRLTTIDHMRTFEGQDPMMRLYRLLGVWRGPLIREGKRDGKTRVTAAQRGRLQERFDAVLRPLGVPQDMVFGS